ncbi:Phosphomannomutase [Psychrobacter nivimaris]|uniref:phosphomannomutase n=1 Tax=Psychrobacter nivimaris TaxID=281738 RepID=A0A6N7BZH7_9GAMM|nr:phosphomannomutase [Psychrobacter nivimaris]KAF0569024.1 Phosphomannomutase [Psychrobacter nivimaris]
MPPFAAQQSLFRAYDIRGANQYFTSSFIQALGHAFATLYNAQDSQPTQNISTNSSVETKQNIVVIGYDMRIGSDAIAHTLSTVLAQQGLRVIQLGLITTPMMAFWAMQYQGHGIVVTASHSAKDILGIKWLVNNKSPSSSEIHTLYHQLTDHHSCHAYPDNQANNPILHSENVESIDNNHDSKLPSDLLEQLPTHQVANVYIDAIAQVFEKLFQHNHSATAANQKSDYKLDLVIVIDCMHGATGSIAQRLFERFCQNVIFLNDTPDGNFPLGNPDPTEPNRLNELQRAVVLHTADIGLAFDGDGDRLMIVDNNGKIVTPDHLLYLLARIAITEHPNSLNYSLLASEVLFDIKCAHHLPRLLSELGTTPVISKTGSSFMRQQVQHPDNQIVFAGELSGHFIFNDSHFIPYDDAMYAALRLLHWLDQTHNDTNDKKPLADIIHSLPPIISTADHYLPMPQTATNDCSLVEQLTRFCHYLQYLVDMSTHTDSSSSQQLKDTCLPVTICKSSACTCATAKAQIALKQTHELLPVGTNLSCIDGVRLDFAHGFGVLRQSNTSNSLTARFAGDSVDDLKDIQDTFAALCRPFNAALAEQILAIPAE